MNTEYQGWKNVETWRLALLLNNDESLYLSWQCAARGLVAAFSQEEAIKGLAEALESKYGDPFVSLDFHTIAGSFL